MFQGQPPKQIQKTTVLLETWLTRQLGWARATGKTLHLVRVYQARVLHGGQVMWCCVRVVQPQVYRACVCIYIYTLYTYYTYASLIYLLFQLYVFLPLCFSEPSPPVVRNGHGGTVSLDGDTAFVRAGWLGQKLSGCQGDLGPGFTKKNNVISNKHVDMIQPFYDNYMILQ